MTEIPTQETKFYILEKKVEELDVKMAKVKHVLWGINGDDDDIGLVGKVAMVTEKMVAIERIAWGILGAVLVTLVAVFYQLIVLHPIP